MSDIATLVADNLDIWTSATVRKSGAGRGSTKRISLYGIERLRALILDLAVRGKLVPQDAGDEPALELLKRIKAERARLIKAKAIGKGKLFPTVSDQPPFAIPAKWIWTQISEIGHDWGQTEPTADFTYIDVGSIDQSLGVVQSPNVVSASDAPSRARKVVQKGTVIYSTVRPYLLNIAIVDLDFDPKPIASTAFAIVHPFAGIEASFIYRYLRSQSFVSYVESCQTGIAYPAINDRQFFAAWCPLPPLAEQRRIVAKVDELMLLCDALEGESADAMAAHQTLVEELLATLVNNTNATDLAVNWARLESHFDTLFTTDASIDALKQTILDLAVRGKLVAQEAGDEAAGTLLKRIQAQRAKLLGARQAEKISASIDGQDGLPFGWEWTPLARLGLAMTGGTPKSSQPENFEGLIPFIGPGQISPTGDILPSEKFISEIGISQSTEAIPGDILMVCIGGSIGKSATAHARMAYNQQINAIRPVIADSRFIDLYLRCSKFQGEVMDRATGSATPIINRGKWETIPVALPPLAEQRRIVAKVDALMALCAALMARLEEAAQTRCHLADTIVGRAAA